MDADTNSRAVIAPESLKEVLPKELSQKGMLQQKELDDSFETFLNDLKTHQGAEAQLNFTLIFMETTLSQERHPHFRNFWEARKICLNLLKENIPPASRANLWEKYMELSHEARRLKELLEEQGAFAAEQIEIAIKAIELEISQFEETLKKMANVVFPHYSSALNKNINLYLNLQQKLNLLNAQASRINALRKELITTEIRIKQKNNFFERLSNAGDSVFPMRKELIKEISHQFISDVDQFILENFSKNRLTEIFSLREEIKTLQSIAKILTLNTQAFTSTRKKLSECWDQIKQIEKEQKKERAELRIQFKENAEPIFKQIEELQKSFEEGKVSLVEARKKIDELSEIIRKTELGRDEIRALRDRLNKANQPIQELLKSTEKDKMEQEKEREFLKKQKLEEIRNKIDLLFKNTSSLEVEQIITERDLLIGEIQQESSFTKLEKLDLEKSLKSLRDVITEKKEKALMSLSDDDRNAILQLTEILKERKARRQEIKDQLEFYRKKSGSSGFDIKEALNYTSLIHEEKERLEKANYSIREIEEKLAQLNS